jgi:small subunit ribosomal protein S16
MVTIRLTRRGTTNTPFFHVVVTDSRKRQGGKSLEQVGFYNPKPVKNEVGLKLDLGRIDYWVSKGAQLSDRVRKIVEKAPATPAASSEPITPASAAATEPEAPAVA